MNLIPEKTRVHCYDCGNEFDAVKPIEEYLNEKCKKCGSILVTQDDIDTHNAVGKFAAMINNLFGVIPEGKAMNGGRISINTASKQITINKTA